jgi:hypothetical protein
VFIALAPVLSDTRNLEPVNARLCDNLMQKEKRTFSLQKKFTATPEQKVGLPVKRANGINGGKP